MKARDKNHAAQRGFTIAELAIATALGLGLVGSVLVGYLAVWTSAAATLDAGKLYQDGGALLNLIVSELRRAGYSGNEPAFPAANPFTAPSTAPAVFDDMASNQRQAPTGSGSCIVFAYDADADGAVDAAELAGFRLAPDGVVQLRTAGDAAAAPGCAAQSSATWTALTDPDFITVSALHFDLAHSTCLLAREPEGSGGSDAGDCYLHPPAAGSGAVTLESIAIVVTLVAHLRDDGFARLTQSRHVQLRNPVVRLH